MARSRHQASPQFTQPVRQIVLMLIVLVLVSVGTYFAYPRVSSVFLANVWLNGFIFLVFVIGVLATFWQVIQLSSSVVWIEGFAAERSGHQMTVAPRLLAPLAALLRSRGRGSHINASSAGSILDSVATRIDEQRDITRYLVNLLIFLGLLGTFYGLATTVPAVVETIRSLAPSENESGLVAFDRLMSGLESQLGGMGTAFSSSLLGLAGSLVVGLLELFASHGQNRFYRELEEWLSSITRLGTTATDGESGGTADMGGLVAVLDAMAEQMDGMRDVLAATEAGRAEHDAALAQLAGAITHMGGQPGGGSDLTRALERIAQGQEQIIALMQNGADDTGPHVEAETRMRLRSIDVQLLRVLEEVSAGRQESTADLRADIATLTSAVRQLGRGSAPAPRPAGKP
ncbi:biopolymer transporter ExbB [Roseicitreum antarcticum]|uniref:Biopolymer transporter ExbB n=1 Tax=Roseicitreum antarcticum TaxID=564137 RepID=A0A1H2UPN8_9RHOB|nr:biopolymer transporter ExbB [Roseicitreum antarcticum]SDW58052.1 hypothetical protein SAMN04488238_102454 [Roseicitreum antarcticum]